MKSSADHREQFVNANHFEFESQIEKVRQKP